MYGTRTYAGGKKIEGNMGTKDVQIEVLTNTKILT
jgi:hypothetical protein